jgi:hypothetical protein
LPPGLRFQPNSYGTAVIFGTSPPDVAGKTYVVHITATNGISPDAVQHLTVISGITTTTTSVSVAPNPAVAGQPVTYTAEVTPVPNGGTVHFYTLTNIPGCGNVPISTATGTATCSSMYLPAGIYRPQAEYSGYGLFLPSVAKPVNLVVNPRPPGYWLAASNGRVFGLGSAPSLGDAKTSPGSGPVVGIAATPDGKGYWVATANGGVSAFGSANLYGDLPALGKHVSDVVAIAGTADGEGYYMVGADGGFFTFGDAKFYGSVPGLGIRTQHVVGMVASPTGTGYLLVGWDGGVFTFGTTHFYGSLPGLGKHVKDIRGALLSSTGTGYALVGSDGGAFTFGSGVKFYGSLPGTNVKVDNVVGIALTPDDGGYYMAGSDGLVYGFGDAKVQPQPPDLAPNLPVAAIAGTPALREPIGLAQRIFQGIEHFLPHDRFGNVSANTTPGAPYGFAGQSLVGFSCLTCDQRDWFWGFTIWVFGSHDAAVGFAVQTIKVDEEAGPGLDPFVPQYVAGDAVMGPAPERIVEAFGLAVGQPVVTVAAGI